MASEIAFCWVPAQGSAVDSDPGVASAGASASTTAPLCAVAFGLGPRWK